MDFTTKTETKKELSGNDKTSHQEALKPKDIQERNYENIDIKSETELKEEPFGKEKEIAANDDIFAQISSSDENQALIRSASFKEGSQKKSPSRNGSQAGNQSIKKNYQENLASVLTDPQVAASGWSAPNEDPSDLGQYLISEVSCKPSTASYSVQLDTIDFIMGRTKIVPSDFTATMTTWREDLWNNLVDPPDDLRASHFIICLPTHIPNSDKRGKFAQAIQNLEMARSTKSQINMQDMIKCGDQLVKKLTLSTKFDTDLQHQFNLMDRIIANSTENLRSVTKLMQVAESQVLSFRDLIPEEVKTLNNSVEKFIELLENCLLRLKGGVVTKPLDDVVVQRPLEKASRASTRSEEIWEKTFEK